MGVVEDTCDCCRCLGCSANMDTSFGEEMLRLELLLAAPDELNGGVVVTTEELLLLLLFIRLKGSIEGCESRSLLEMELTGLSGGLLFACRLGDELMFDEYWWLFEVLMGLKALMRGYEG